MANNEMVKSVTARLREAAQRREALAPAVMLAIIGFGIYAFLEIAEDMAEGELRAADEWLFLALRNPADLADALGPPWLEEAALEITALGGYALIVLATAAVAGLLLVTRRYGAALYTVVSVASGALILHLLKRFYERPRPDLVDHLDAVHTASFPSGHALVTTVAYLTLAALVIRFFADWRVRAYVLFVAVFVSVAVGVSRVYLGVHWPSDVAAGWALGAAWASLVWLVAALFRLQRRRVGRGVGREE